MVIKSPLMIGCLTLGLALLSACSNSANCSGGNYRGGCAAGPDTETPTAATPVLVSPPAAAPAPAAPAATGPIAGTRGDPADFADVDDKQCRSYGLTYGTHDYADCRIRLSAQHRGLDPNIGTVPANR
jgi:hypothetical protein